MLLLAISQTLAGPALAIRTQALQYLINDLTFPIARFVPTAIIIHIPSYRHIVVETCIVELKLCWGHPRLRAHCRHRSHRAELVLFQIPELFF